MTLGRVQQRGVFIRAPLGEPEPLSDLAADRASREVRSFRHGALPLLVQKVRNVLVGLSARFQPSSLAPLLQAHSGDLRVGSVRGLLGRAHSVASVSYTHLDVYKRQVVERDVLALSS